MTRFVAALIVLAVSACAPERGRCLLDSLQPMARVELFFGRDIPGREPLTEREWSDFAASVIAKEFPDGFTVMEGDGEWRDPAMQRITHERSKILIVAAPKSSDLASRVVRVRDAYRRMYRQTSVGVLTYDACGEF